MDQHIGAIFENGVFRPETPVNIGDGQRVLLNIVYAWSPVDDLSDVRDLIDAEFIEFCRQHTETGLAPSLAEAQEVLSAFQGSLADRISEERDNR